MNPVLNAPLGPDGLPVPVDPEKVQEFFEDFYEDVFLELDKYGVIEHLCVCDNLADHMVGNVYVKFRDEEGAARALQALQGRYYAGKPIQVEFSPVTDFKESTCRQYEQGSCNRGGYCNFMHVRPVSRRLRKQLFGRYGDGHGGSTRFHDDRRDGGRHDDYDRYGGRNRRDRDRDRRYRDSDRGRYDRRDERRRGSRRDESGGGRDSSEERRARIAQWNAEAGAAAAPAPAAAPPPMYNGMENQISGGYGAPGGYTDAWASGANAPPPASVPPYPPYASAYGGAMQPQPPLEYQHAQPQQYGHSVAMNGLQQQQQRQMGSGGGSGANTVPISNMRSFPQPPPS